jgi:hypothetical protein
MWIKLKMWLYGYEYAQLREFRWEMKAVFGSYLTHKARKKHVLSDLRVSLQDIELEFLCKKQLALLGRRRFIASVR